MQLVGRCARRYIDAIAHTCAHHGRYVPMRNREYACALITVPARTLAQTVKHKCTSAQVQVCTDARTVTRLDAGAYAPPQWIHASIPHICAYRHEHACTHSDIDKNTMRAAYRQEHARIQARRHAGTRARMQTGAWCMVHIHVCKHILERIPTRAHA